MEHLKEKHLFIRADAGTQMGTGHLMRCLALTQAWQDVGGKVIFITACQDESLLQRLQEEGFDIHLLTHPYPDPGDWDHTRNILTAYPDAWVVLDGYHFDEIYQQRVKDAGHRLLVIDDMANLKHYYADIVLNQNLHAELLPYPCEPYTRLLPGTRYVLLRREFLAWRDWKHGVPEAARRVLVTLGGGDPENHTLKVIEALQKVDVPGLEAVVVVGASNPHADALEVAARQSRVPVRLIRNARDMPELMASADVAISTAGSTVWELAWMGVPTALLIQADNQRQVAEELHRVGAVVSLGDSQVIDTPELVENLNGFLRDSEHLQMIIRRIKTLVDGEGVSRVMRHIMGEELRLRQVHEGDCGLLWEWTNDPAVRAASFSSEFIPWEDHVKWFRTKLSDPSCHYYIFLNEEGVPVGQVRFETSGDEAEISISIAPNFRAHGYGANGIRIASKRLFQETNAARIYAHIKPSSHASICAFRQAGYRMAGTKVVKRHKALQMVLDKNKEAFEGDPH